MELESPENDPHKYIQLIFDRRKTVFSTHGVEKFGHVQAKKKKKRAHTKISKNLTLPNLILY